MRVRDRDGERAVGTGVWGRPAARGELRGGRGGARPGARASRCPLIAQRVAITIQGGGGHRCCLSHVHPRRRGGDTRDDGSGVEEDLNGRCAAGSPHLESKAERRRRTVGIRHREGEGDRPLLAGSPPGRRGRDGIVETSGRAAPGIRERVARIRIVRGGGEREVAPGGDGARGGDQRVDEGRGIVEGWSGGPHFMKGESHHGGLPRGDGDAGGLAGEALRAGCIEGLGSEGAVRSRGKVAKNAAPDTVRLHQRLGARGHVQCGDGHLHAANVERGGCLLKRANELRRAHGLSRTAAHQREQPRQGGEQPGRYWILDVHERAPVARQSERPGRLSALRHGARFTACPRGCALRGGAGC